MGRVFLKFPMGCRGLLEVAASGRPRFFGLRSGLVFASSAAALRCSRRLRRRRLASFCCPWCGGPGLESSGEEAPVLLKVLGKVLVYLPILTTALLPCWLPPPHPFLHPLRDSRDRGSRPRTRLHHKPSHTHITQHQTALQNTAQPPHNTPPPSCPSTSFTPSPISSPPPPPAPLILPLPTPPNPTHSSHHYLRGLSYQLRLTTSFLPLTTVPLLLLL